MCARYSHFKEPFDLYLLQNLYRHLSTQDLLQSLTVPSNTYQHYISKSVSLYKTLLVSTKTTRYKFPS